MGVFDSLFGVMQQWQERRDRALEREEQRNQATLLHAEGLYEKVLRACLDLRDTPLPGTVRTKPDPVNNATIPSLLADLTVYSRTTVADAFVLYLRHTNEILGTELQCHPHDVETRTLDIDWSRSEEAFAALQAAIREHLDALRGAVREPAELSWGVRALGRGLRSREPARRLLMSRSSAPVPLPEAVARRRARR